MKDLKVIGWTDWENYEGYIVLDRFTMEEEEKIHEAIIKELREKGFKFTGSYHQQGRYGTPVLEIDGIKFIYRATQREWGGVMAEAFPENNKNDGFDYCTWAWLVPENEEMVIPSDKLIEAEW